VVDNVAITAGTGTTVATDDVGGVHYQLVKVVFGALDSASLVTPALGLPVAQVGSLPAGTNIIGRTGDATDVGRVTRHFIFDTPTASPAAETLASVTQWYNNAAVAATTTPAVVPTGKVLRITGMRLATASLAAAGMVVLRLRANVAGVAVVGSPLVASLQVGSQAAVAALQDHDIINFPEGIDFPAGTGIGLTHQGYVGATGTLQSFSRFEAWGYEYTA